MRCKLIIAGLLFLLITNIQAQEKYFFEKLSVSDGLSNSVVLCTYQDHLGYLWIGTVDGLDRYDGYDMKVYKNIPNDSTSIPSNIIYSIKEDSEGNLFIGTSDYVSRYYRATDTFSNIRVEKGAQLNVTIVNNILCDSKKRIWISTDYTGVQLFDKNRNRFIGVNYRDYNGNLIPFSTAGFVQNLAELKNGNILIADDTFGVFIYNASKNEFSPYFADPRLDLKGIYAIFEDNAGKIWFAGKADIYIYNPVTYSLKSLNIPQKFPDINRNIFYTNIYTKSSNEILIASDFGILSSDMNGDNVSLITENIPGLIPTNFYRDNFGIYWISTSGLGLVKFDPAKKPFQFYKINIAGQNESAINPVIDVVLDPLNRNNLIVANSTKDLLRFNRASGNFSKILDLISAGTSHNLLPDENGYLWYTDDNSLKKLEIRTGRLENFPFKKAEYSRGEFTITRLKYGPDRKIWIANRQGIQTFDPLKNSFSRLPTIMNKPVDQELISSIREIVKNEKPIESILKVGEGTTITEEFNLEKQTKMLVVNLGEGRQTGLLITMFDYGTLENAQGKKIWSADTIQNTFHAGGGFKNRIAFGCLDLPKGKYKLKYRSGIGHNYGNFNVPAPPDSIWYGIQILPISDEEYSILNPKIQSAMDNTHFPPMEIALDEEFSRKYVNTLWLAANGVGLIKLNLADNTYHKYRFDDGTSNFPLINQILRILEDKDGIIWLSTAVGLIRFDPETEKFNLVTRDEGLVSNVIVFMKEDNNGNIWFGTTGGISMLNKKSSGDNFSFINYDNTDGIHDMPLNNSVCMTDDGEILYGGYGGLNAFFPGSLNSTLPKPVITSLKLSGIPIEKLASDLDIKKDISELDEITLPYSENNLSFEFASIHYSRPAKNKLAYMLEGIDKNWNYTNKRFASYINLPPGEFVFRLKGSNGDGVWNPKEAAIKIIINPPWWRTTIAYIAYVLLFAGIIFGFDRFQRKRIRSKEREAAKLNEAELRAQMAEAENERKTKELEEARSLQLSMLPKELPQLPNLDVAVYMQTATEVGGDYYDFHVGLDGTLTVVVGDATGHGMKAGTMVTTAKTLFKSYASNPDILFSFQEFTRCIKQMNFGKLSMCLTMLKIKGDKMQISTAAMPPSLIFRKETKAVEEYLFQAMPLGSMKEFPYELKDTALSSGDTILLMSDGLPELENKGGEMYGYKRIRSGFEEVAEQSPQEIISFLKNEGAVWVNNEDPDDDVTFVVIKVK